MARRTAWNLELTGALAAHRPTLGWLPDHLGRMVPHATTDAHLLSLASDLCDAGHIHLDIVLWLLTSNALHSIVVSEEHYDRGPESVDTTFETTVATHPLDTIVGTQVSTASHPDGTQMDASLAVMLDTPGHTGHADPVVMEDPDILSYAMVIQPTSLVFTVVPERTLEIAGFAHSVLERRAALKGR